MKDMYKTPEIGIAIFPLTSTSNKTIQLWHPEYFTDIKISSLNTPSNASQSHSQGSRRPEAVFVNSEYPFVGHIPTESFKSLLVKNGQTAEINLKYLKNKYLVYIVFGHHHAITTKRHNDQLSAAIVQKSHNTYKVKLVFNPPNTLPVKVRNILNVSRLQHKTSHFSKDTIQQILKEYSKISQIDDLPNLVAEKPLEAEDYS